jgi:predicted RNase H-like nuclease (RuvC/YqgF family)
MVQTTNKREREEIEGLKRELQRTQEEAKARDSKQRGQIDRLTRQVEELKLQNKELNEEVRLVSEQLKSAGRNASTSAANHVSMPNQSHTNSQLQAQQQQNRYTFSTKEEKQAAQ